MSGDIPSGSLGTTNDVSQLIEELQYTLGEGPCVDAHVQDRVVTEPDLADPVTPRWVAFTPPVLRAGARALFGFPLRIGMVRLGALNLYRDQPGSLSGEQYADALTLAGLVAQSVLAAQAGAPAGTVPSQLESEADFRFVVHNAAGMVSVQLDITVTDALIRLRAYAFSHDRPITDVAQERGRPQAPARVNRALADMDKQIRSGLRPGARLRRVLPGAWRVSHDDPRI